MQKDAFQEKSFWLSTRDYRTNPSFEGETSVDVAIVGGGFSGLSAAYHLKQADPGLKIALLESQVTGYGGSGRNAGFSNSLFGESLLSTAARFGRENAKAAYEYVDGAVTRTRELIEETGIDCDYEHVGSFRVATSPQYEAAIRDELDQVLALGISGIEWRERDQVQAEVASPLHLGAWWQPNCGLLNPAQLSWGWREVLMALDVALYDYSPVTEFSKQPGQVRLTTPGGHIHAQKMVLATNAYSKLIPGLRLKQVPVWTHIVLTEPLTAAQLAPIGWQKRQGLDDARHMAHYYRLTADNRLLMGGRDISLGYGASIDHDLNPTTFAGLEKNVLDMFPSLRGIRFTHRWGGPVSLTLDMIPALGYLGDQRIVYGLGFIGHGVAMTHRNGQILADLVLERQTPLTDLFFVNRRALPLPPEPLRYLAIGAVRAFLRAQDRRSDPRLPAS